MIIERIDRLPNGTRIIDKETGQDVYYLNKCPACGREKLHWVRSCSGPGAQWALACYSCESATDFFPSKFDALENKVYDL